jgi:hypothetical protein
MLLIVALTAASGFLASYGLLRAGMAEMWLRYLAAVAIAYVAFLGLLWLWMRTRPRDYEGIGDAPSGNGGGAGSGPVGKGGESGGGGAGVAYEAPPTSGAEAGGSVEAAAEAAAAAASGADELAIPVGAAILLALIALSLLGSFWVVYSAPVFLAELLVDGVLAAALYRRLRAGGPASRHWLETAVRRTLWPMTVVAVSAAVAGWIMALYAPGARSIGDVLIHANGLR